MQITHINQIYNYYLRTSTTAAEHLSADALSASLRIARYSARQRPITADNRTSFCGA